MQLLSHQQRALLNHNQLVFWLTCTLYYTWKETWEETNGCSMTRLLRNGLPAKDMRLWDNLNLPIFCHCLVMQQTATLQPWECPKPSNSPYTRSSVCQLWNFEDACRRWGCQFLYNCYYCRGPHKASNCPTGVKKGPNQLDF